jgi:hypothetical protein
MKRPDRTVDPERNPVPDAKFDELRNVLTWLYGSKARDIEPAVKTQNRDLSRLRDVLGSAAATATLAQRNDLNEATITATPADVRFQTHLITANAELQHAVSTLEGFDAEAQPELASIASSAVKRASIVKLHIDAAVASLGID